MASWIAIGSPKWATQAQGCIASWVIPRRESRQAAAEKASALENELAAVSSRAQSFEKDVVEEEKNHTTKATQQYMLSCFLCLGPLSGYQATSGGLYYYGLPR